MTRYYNTFSRELLSKVKRARRTLINAVNESRHNNRDTQMIMTAVKIIEQVIEYDEKDQN